MMSFLDENKGDDDAAPRSAGVVSRIYEKWGKAAIAGFQPVPDLLLKNQVALGLTPTDITVLLNVMMHWWYPEKMPFPRPTTIAKRMGVNVRTVQRSLSAMEAAGIIGRISSKDGPSYINPEPLVKRLSELADHDKDYQIRAKRLEEY